MNCRRWCKVVWLSEQHSRKAEEMAGLKSDKESRKVGKGISRLWCFVCCVLVAGFCFVVVSGGCSRLPSSNPGTRSGDVGESDADSLESIQASFNRAADLPSCRAVIRDLNAHLGQ